MKRRWLFLLVVGLAVGFTAGFFVKAAWDRPAAIQGTAFFRDFSLTNVLVKAGCSPKPWKIVEDRVYERLPWMSKSTRIGRRVVAQAELSDADFAVFSSQFRQAAMAVLVAQGGLNKAQFDLVKGSSRAQNGSIIQSRFELPRCYYAIGEVHGVADFWYVAESGRVTVMVSLMEGL